jgi:AAA15 family ATPase/GTPase
MSLIFKKIENGNIFTRDFSSLVRNNEISFPAEKIAVIYGPNGTGKTSLIKVLADVKETKVEFSLDDVEHQSGAGVFHIINDQNNRNIISGETRDFFLGDNIRHEFELQDQVSTDRSAVLSAAISLLKNTFGISAGNSPLIDLITEPNVAAL